MQAPQMVAAVANSAQRSAERHAKAREGPLGALDTVQAAGRPPTATLVVKKTAPEGTGTYAQALWVAVPVGERMALNDCAGDCSDCVAVPRVP